MTVQDISTLISTLGFPIVACAALFWFNLKTTENYNKNMEDMRETIEANTKATEALIQSLNK